ALGRGLTVDGTTPTSGFQPIFTFLLAPLFLITPHDQITPIRFIIGAHWLIFFMSALLLGRVLVKAVRPAHRTDERLLFWIGVFTYSASALLFLGSFNGLETGLLLLCLLTIIRCYQKTNMNTPGEYIRLGALLGILVLVRVDQVFLVVVATVVCLFAPRKNSKAARFKSAAALGGTAFLVSLPWWLYCLYEFGSLMPSGGAATQVWDLTPFRIERGLIAIFCNLMPIIYLGQNHLEGLLVHIARTLLVVGGLCLLWVDRSWFTQKFQTERSVVPVFRRTVWACGILLGSNLLLLMYYTLASSAVYFYVRYMAGAAVASLLVISFLIWKSLLRTRFPGIAFLLIEGTLIVAALALIAQGRAMTYIPQLTLIKEHVPASERVAAFQTGTVSYFRDGVINLDGKVNQQALSRRADIVDYLKEHNINWICDAKEIVPLILHADSLRNRTWEFVGERANFVLYRRFGITAD
ncbi:MAG: hypothetical protein HY961_14780, partial [Ignavibacteriae bacterium]|nr:hypothetical protein [Ignavibacteriota bacterium]